MTMIKSPVVSPAPSRSSSPTPSKSPCQIPNGELLNELIKADNSGDANLMAELQNKFDELFVAGDAEVKASAGDKLLALILDDDQVGIKAFFSYGIRLNPESADVIRSLKDALDQQNFVHAVRLVLCGAKPPTDSAGRKMLCVAFLYFQLLHPDDNLEGNDFAHQEIANDKFNLSALKKMIDENKLTPEKWPQVKKALLSNLQFQGQELIGNEFGSCSCKSEILRFMQEQGVKLHNDDLNEPDFRDQLIEHLKISPKQTLMKMETWGLQPEPDSQLLSVGLEAALRADLESESLQRIFKYALDTCAMSADSLQETLSSAYREFNFESLIKRMGKSKLDQLDLTSSLTEAALIKILSASESIFFASSGSSPWAALILITNLGLHPDFDGKVLKDALKRTIQYAEMGVSRDAIHLAVSLLINDLEMAASSVLDVVTSKSFSKGTIEVLKQIKKDKGLLTAALSQEDIDKFEKNDEATKNQVRQYFKIVCKPAEQKADPAEA